MVEGYHKLEIDGENQYAEPPEPLRWSAVHVCPTLRVCREEDGTLCVFAKVDGATVQADIARLKAAPVEMVEAGAADEPEDDRPLWQRRLDAEREEETLSSIP